MAQIVKIIDLTKSYVPGDPNAFPSNLHFTKREDDPDEVLPILAYEGYNFLPTSYGYRSYFGIESALTLEALPTPCDQIITFQSKQYENMLIAFCSDGIRTARAGATVWTHSIPLTDEWLTNGIYKQYTWAVIENNLYIYRQGHTHVIKIDDDLTITQFIPSFLNMAGQMGIFRGNGRLCFWDSENSIAWSSAFDLTDFTPSIENMVGNSIFLGVLGRIVNVLPHGEGFVIYCTRSIVGVSYSTTGTAVWDAMTITSAGGIAHPGACTIGQNDKEHYAYTTLGIISIGHFNALSRQYDMKPILPELFDFLKESRDPVYLHCHAARFLYFSVIDDAYIIGITSFTNVQVPSLQAPPITIDTSLWDTYSALPYITPNETFQLLDSFLWNRPGVGNIDRTQSVFDAPYYTAVVDIPNYKSQANSMGLLDIGNPMRRHTEPAVNDNLTKAQMDVGFSTYDFAANTSYIPTITYNASKYLNNNVEITRPRVKYDSVYYFTWDFLDQSYYPKLYPQDIMSEGNSVADLLYNFIGAMREYEQFVVDNYANMLAMINEINAQDKFTHRIFSWAALDFSNQTSQNTTPIIIPRKGLTVSVDFNNSGAGVSEVSINASIRDYVRFDTSLCTRKLLSQNVGSITEANVQYSMYMFTHVSGSQVDPTATVYLDHVPSVADIVAAFDTPDMYQTETATGHKWKLYYDETERPVGVTGTSSEWSGNIFYCRAVNLTTGVKAFRRLSVTCVHKTMSMSYNYIAYSGYTHGLESLYAQGYTKLGVFSQWKIHSYQTSYASCHGSVEMQWDFFVHGASTKLTSLAAVSQIVYEISRTGKTGSELSSDGSLILYAEVRINGTTDPFIYSAIVAMPRYTVNIYTVEESLLYALIPLSVNDPIVANSAKNIQIRGNLALTHRGIDTITMDMFGRGHAVNKSIRFTPVVTDPGGSAPLTFNPTSMALAYTKNHNIMECIPWSIESYIDNNAKVVNGQHFMEHAAGTMLTVPQLVGPIPSITDSGNACYPDLDADGWIISDPKFTYPPATFTLQDGVPVPAYPTLVGSFVMDMHLKKWGKQAGEFSCLLQFSPINATNNEAIPYTNFGMDSGILSPFDKKIKLFAQNDDNSVMRYGKIGFYRLGFTEMLEVNINFRTPYTGSIIVDGSVDANHLNTEIQHVEDFVDVTQALVKCHVNARWHTISITGNFDLQYMEFRGIMAARR